MRALSRGDWRTLVQGPRAYPQAARRRVPRMPPRLRRATLDDVPLLVLHRRLMWRDMGTFPEETLAPADAPYRRWLRARLKSGSAVAWVAESGGRPVASGVVWVQPVQPRPTMPEGRMPYLLSVYVDPAHRGKGLATRLTKAAIAWSRAQGYPKLALHASAQGRSVYERLGFEPTTEMRLTLRGARGPARRGARAPSPVRSPTRRRRSPARPAGRRSTGS